jgi:hypothetical protein
VSEVCEDLEPVGETEDRLLETLQASEDILDDLGDSDDPVAQREVLDALLKKGDALAKLGRFAESVEVWDEVVTRCADGAPAGRTRAVIVALVKKAEALAGLGDDVAVVEVTALLLDACADLEPSVRVRRIRLRALELKRDALQASDLSGAAAVDEEIVREFGEAQELEFRWGVAFALSHKAWTLLRQDRVNEALLVSERIVQRFLGEPDVTLVAAAPAAAEHSRHLASVSGPGPAGVATFAAFALLNTAEETLRSAIRATRILPTLVRAFRLEVVGGLAQQLVPGRLAVDRRRLAQAIIVSDALISRLAASDEPELQVAVATAQTIKFSTQIALGHALAGFRAFDALTESDQPGVVQAFQRLAAQSGRSSATVDRVGEISFLSHRARALGQGDRRIERIAYDDSLQARRHRDDDPALVRWLAHRMRPRSKRRWRRSSSDPV